MATDSDPAQTLAALQQHLREQQEESGGQTIDLLTPSDPGFAAARLCYIRPPATAAPPLAIARPRTETEVQTLVRYCAREGVDFVVRAGGHDCAGRSQVPGALTIDVRGLDRVSVAEDRRTVVLGGGVLFGDLARVLDPLGLVTPVGTVASVGYVGWATLGGYGPFSGMYGLGADQIAGARLVDARGELVDANEELLKGIRGGGGIFGVIVELTVKVYPLKELLISLLIFDPSNLNAAWTSFAAGYSALLHPSSSSSDEPLPRALQLQPFGIELPHLGRVFAIGATWASDDQAEGRRWIDRIAALVGPCIVNDPKPTSVAAYAEFNESLVTFGSFGRCYTLNLARLTPAVAGVLAKHTAALPGGGIGLAVHTLREQPAVSGTAPPPPSVFGARVPHHMVELVAATATPELEAAGAEWAARVLRELREVDPRNVLESSYVSLVGTGDDADYRRIYGGHYDVLVELKRKYDPRNVFKYAVPRLFS